TTFSTLNFITSDSVCFRFIYIDLSFCFNNKFKTEKAINIMTNKITQYAAATPSLPKSTADKIATVIKFQLAETKNMTALMEVKARVNAYVALENNADLNNGKVILQKVVNPLAFSDLDASSSDVSICIKAFVPASIPKDIYLKTSTITKTAAVPVMASGGLLNERRYPIPTTVPGTANNRIEPISTIFFPGKVILTVKKEIIIPRKTTTGAAITEIITVSWMVFRHRKKT